jgi:hypothetical protein
MPEDLKLLQERWIRGEITDAEFRAEVVKLVRKRAPDWSPAPGSVLAARSNAMTQTELDELSRALEPPPGFDPWATCYPLPATDDETTHSS